MTAARIFDITFGNLVRFAQNAAFRKEEHGPVSWGFVGTLLLVLCYGLIMLFSASYVTAYYRFGDIYHYIKPQVILALGGLFLFCVSLYQERSGRSVRETLSRQCIWFQWGVMLCAMAAIFMFGMYGAGITAGEFVYMQF